MQVFVVAKGHMCLPNEIEKILDTLGLPAPKRETVLTPDRKDDNRDELLRTGKSNIPDYDGEPPW